MTSWIFSFGWNWLLGPVAIWFLNGLRKAVLKPRVRYLSHSIVGSDALVTIERQELLPPWRTLVESYLVRPGHHPCRESDGHTCKSIMDNDTTGLGERIEAVLMVAKVRTKETEELSK